MKCKEFAEILYETKDLKELENHNKLLSHALICKECNNLLTFEKKLRGGFEIINNERPSQEIEAKILAIPEIFKEDDEEEVFSFKELINDWISQFSFKTAFISCLVVFLMAILIYKSETPQPTINLLQPEILTQKEKAEEKEPVSQETLVLNDEIIPGAISFKLTQEDISEEETMYAFHDISLDDEPTILRSAASTDSFHPQMRRAAAPMARSIETRDERADEIKQLLETINLEPAEGFLDLNSLAARGYIASDRLIDLRPPAGSGWYIEKTESGINIRLKSNR